jgi:protease I
MQTILITIIATGLFATVTSRAAANAGAGEDEHLPLEGLRVALVTGEGFQDQEALMPLAFLENRGATVTVVGPETGKVKSYNSDVHLIIRAAAADVSAADFDALVLPGGTAPAKIRENEHIVALARQIFEAGKPVAAICHGPQVLVAADVIEGRTMTCYEKVADELRAAGANYKDQAMVQDGNLITSRIPTDIPEWLAAIETLFATAAKK